jgi:hypothetical protein
MGERYSAEARRLIVQPVLIANLVTTIKGSE